MRLSRSLGVVAAACGLLVMANPVAADSRDIDQGFQISFFPCLAGPHPPSFVSPSPGPGNDGAFHICFVNIGAGGWQATTGEWILFRVRAGSFASNEDCLAANPTATGLLDGVAVPVDVSCLQRNSTTWVASFRILSHPLTVGDHSVGLSFSLGGSAMTATDSVAVIEG